VPVRDGHLCCGSAGTYSLLQPEISAVCVTTSSTPCRGGAESIVSANIGCIEHLGSAAKLPVRHWVELLFDDENVT
jgi:glycolate oxidase iron-sulfur subunit